MNEDEEIWVLFVLMLVVFLMFYYFTGGENL